MKEKGHWGIIIEIIQECALKMWFYMRHLKKSLGKIPNILQKAP